MKNAILEYLLEEANGSENAKSGQEICEVFGLKNTYVLRKHVKDLRNDPEQHFIIGSSPKGYYIPKENEHQKAIQLMLSKTLSQIKTTINIYPRAAGIIHAVAGKSLREAKREADGQLGFDFEEWELKVVKKYAEEL